MLAQKAILVGHFWLTMIKDVAQLVKTYFTCQLLSRMSHKSTELLKAHACSTNGE